MELTVSVNPQERSVRFREVHALAAGDVYNPVTLSGVPEAQTAALALKLYKDSSASRLLAQCASFSEIKGRPSLRRGVLTLATQALKTWYEEIANGAEDPDANGLPSALVDAWLVVSDSTRTWAACPVPLVLRAMDTNVVQGADGISPTVSVTKEGSVTTIAVTDVNGTHVSTVNDGTDGAPGVSPVVAVDTNPATGDVRITVVNADGSSSSKDVPVTSACADTLSEAKAYADDGDEAALASAKTYADGKDEVALASARAYVDETARSVRGELASHISDAGSALAAKADLVDGKVPAAQLPSFVDDVLEYDATSAFPAAGEAGKIYVAKDTNLAYRWGGTGYVEISQSLALGETAATAYPGDKGAAAAKLAADAAKNANAAQVSADTANTAIGEFDEAFSQYKTEVKASIDAVKTAADTAQQTADEASRALDDVNIGIGGLSGEIGEVRSTAETAKSTADEAKSAANEANNNLAGIGLRVVDAEEAATAAKKTADEAKTAAENANSTANNASVTALDAIGMASDAQARAENASMAAEVANSLANEVNSSIYEHSLNIDNPHSVTAAQVGAYAKTEVDAKLSGKADKVKANAASAGEIALAADSVTVVDGSSGTAISVTIPTVGGTEMRLCELLITGVDADDALAVTHPANCLLADGADAISAGANHFVYAEYQRDRWLVTKTVLNGEVA